MKRPNAPWLNIICRSASSSSRRSITKQINHYDTLETHSKATHNEIKSAYFKLSKQYHPDMNSSTEAKGKFNDISLAYEILGNHSKRKQYDRGLQVSPSYYDEPHVSMRKTDFTDIMQEAKRVHTELNRKHYTQEDGTPIYDFDAWAQAHYGKVFERRQKDLSKYRWLMQERAEINDGRTTTRNEAIMLCGFVTAICILVSVNMNYWGNMDHPKIISNADSTLQNDSENSKQSEN